MKASRLAALGLAIAIASASAVAEVNVMKITYKDGNTVSYNTQEITDISFTTASSESNTEIVSGYECVDLGLPSGLKWATCNVGAAYPEQYGYYFGWGETETKSEYNIFKGTWSGKTTSQLLNSGVIDPLCDLTPEYDAATVIWGEDWRTPTKDEWQELIDNCVWIWVQNWEFAGVTVVGPNGNSIFIPAAGNYHGFRDEHGRYWSSTAYVNDDRAWACYFDNNNHYVTTELPGTGIPVRAVTTGDAPLPAPQHIVAAYTDGSITVTWDAVDGATSYTVFRSANGYEFAEIGTSDTDSFVDNSPETGWNYYCVQAIWNNGVKGVFSSVSNAVPGKPVGADGYECVDLGLSSGTMWATCNLGAQTPSDHGDFYAWGEIKTKPTYSEQNYSWLNKNTSVLMQQGVIDDQGNLTPQYDAATANMGINWRMPTNREIAELVEECSWISTTVDGQQGAMITGPNGNSIFIPLAGYMYDDELLCVNTEFNLWSSTIYDEQEAYFLFYDGGTYNLLAYRFIGFSIRPVCTTKALR